MLSLLDITTLSAIKVPNLFRLLVTSVHNTNGLVLPTFLIPLIPLDKRTQDRFSRAIRGIPRLHSKYERNKRWTIHARWNSLEGKQNILGR